MNFRRFAPYRSSVQLVVALLLVSPLAGFTFFQGTLAAADIFGLPLADPLAALQVMLASGVAVPGFILSAAGVTLFYFLLGGRFFCGWVCPVYLITEVCDKFRRWTGGGARVLPQATKTWMLLLSLVGTALCGLPLFETLSPIGIFSRAAVFGSYAGISILAGIVLMETIFARRVWCRSLCPLGGFYSLVGRHSPLRVGYLQERCSQCGECSQVCPVEEVLSPCLSGGATEVVSGDCTRCAACIDVCQDKALKVSYGIFR